MERLNALRSKDPVARLGWALSPHGSIAACKRLDASGDLLLEVRRPFTGHRRRVHRVDGLTPDSPVIIGDSGTIIVCVRRDDGWQPMEILPNGHRRAWPSMAPVTARIQRGPAGTLHVHQPYDTGTRITRLSAGALTVLGVVPYRVIATHTWDTDTLFLDVVGDSGHSHTVRLDLTSGTTEGFYSVSDRSDDRVVRVAPRADLVVVSTTACGEQRIGWGRLGAGRIGFPDAGAGDRGISLAWLAEDGSRAVLAEDRGLRMPLRLVELSSGDWQHIELPPVYLAGPATMTDAGLVFPAADPRHPGTMIRIGIPDPNLIKRNLINSSMINSSMINSELVSYDDPPVPVAADCRIVDIPGPSGPIESLIVGDPERATQVVVALHGGPIAAWRAAYNPLFGDLAAAGAAVVAPNIRGSLGYGREHMYAIKDRWGTVDLDDVGAVRDWLQARRPYGATPPVLVGESYGAYLALLVASTAAPRDWSGCAALAAFTSGARIAALGTRVSEMVRRLGGQASPDLLRCVGRIDVPVLLLHGDHDQTVPVGESMELAHALQSAGVPVQLVRDPVGDHDLVSGGAGVDHRSRLVAFVRAVGRSDAADLGPQSRFSGTADHHHADHYERGEFLCRSMNSI